jgi:hypothetical protein
VRKAALLWVGIGSVAGCGERAGGCIDVGKPMELMARPLYSDTIVVGRIEPGRHTYTRTHFDHVYLWYEVRTPDGVTGHLIVDPAVARVECRQPFRDPRDRPRPSTIPWARDTVPESGPPANASGDSAG